MKPILEIQNKPEPEHFKFQHRKNVFSQPQLLKHDCVDL